MKRGALILAALAAGVLTSIAGAAPGGSAGPSSSQDPYLVRSQPGVVFKSILTTGDSVGSYRMVGIPDGLGAFDNGNGTFTLLMNHELGNTSGVARAHGGTGAFVSKWVINQDDLAVVSGQDLIQHVNLWNGTAYVETANVTFNRFCSADLPPVSALYNAATGKGYNGRLFVDGEEGGTGRGFAHTLDGTSYETPWFGKMAFENSLANSGTGDRTIVVSQDDQGGDRGQVYIYAGDKRSTGNPVEKAGFTGGTLYGVKVNGFAFENAATGIPSGTRFGVYSFGDASAKSVATLENESNANSVTQFQRPEDGAWDPDNANVYYFVTTDQFPGVSRLWRLTFDNAAHPELGGTIDMLLDGTEGQQMLDNLTVNGRGQIVAQEDIGNNTPLGKVWLYDIASDTMTQLAEHDPNRFSPGAPAFLTSDEESSGVINASSILGEGWYLLDVQAHYPIAGELVEGGQLLAMHVPPGKFPKK
jgi:secreted PhoX family phosphatase